MGSEKQMADKTPAPINPISVKQFVDGKQLKEDVSFSDADLSSAMMEQASMFAHYGVLAAQAARQVDQMKTRLEIAESAVYRSLRDDLTAKGEKFTEGSLGAAVALHPEIRRHKMAVNEAKQIEQSAKIAVEAFRHRRDMLIQMGLISREEMKGELVVRKKQVVQDADQDVRDQVMQRLKDTGQVA